MTADKFKESIVEMVAFEGIALRFFSTPASKKLLSEMAAKLGVSLARDRVRSYVIAAAEQLQLKIKADLKDKFIHLKFDTATRIRTNYLGNWYQRPLPQQQQRTHYADPRHQGHAQPTHQF